MEKLIHIFGQVVKNLVRMVNIISRDLIRLYPQNKAKIEKNVNKFTNDLLKT